MTNRLPVVGSDDNTWGTVLNDYLAVAHNPDGTDNTITPVSSASTGGSYFYDIGSESPPNINEVLLCDCTGCNWNGLGVLGIGLPDATDPDWNTNMYTIKKVDSNSNPVYIVPDVGGQTIDGGSDAYINVQDVSLSLVSDGSNWYVI